MSFAYSLQPVGFNTHSMANQSLWPMQQQPSETFAYRSWDSYAQVTTKQNWFNNLQQVPQFLPTAMPLEQDAFVFPPSPTSLYNSYTNNSSINFNEYSYPSSSQTQFTQSLSREITPPSSGSNSPSTSISTPLLVSKEENNSKSRRKSTESHSTPTRTYRRRSSSHPSVASVVSLSAHEPIARVIDGIEYITFLYSHDRLVKEYTVRTDVYNVCLDQIPEGFRVQNAIYPRANVPRHEYDGNRWEYETNCNKLGWELCWLNQEQLCGRRGLIQRAVDTYRNRHTDMRSRRVTRQEKVLNGTLRKKKGQKDPVCHSVEHILLP